MDTIQYPFDHWYRGRITPTESGTLVIGPIEDASFDRPPVVAQNGSRQHVAKLNGCLCCSSQ